MARRLISGRCRARSKTRSTAGSPSHEVKKGEKPYLYVDPNNKTNCAPGVGIGYPEWTQNISWHVDGEEMHGVPITDSDDLYEPRAVYAETGSSQVTIQGEFRYNGPLPVERMTVIDPSSGHPFPMDDLSQEPVEDLMVTVTDSCSEPRTAEKELKFRVRHKLERLDEATVTVSYRQSATSNKETETADSDNDYCHGDKCEQFERSNISFFFIEPEFTMEWVDGVELMEILNDEIEPEDLDGLFDVAGAYSVFPLRVLRNAEGWKDYMDHSLTSLKKNLKPIKSVMNVGDVRNVVLRQDTPDTEADVGTNEVDNNERDRDNLIIKRVVFETKQWKAVLDLNGHGLPPWNMNDCSELKPGGALIWPLSSDQVGWMNRHNSDGGIFERKPIVEYD